MSSVILLCVRIAQDLPLHYSGSKVKVIVEVACDLCHVVFLLVLYPMQACFFWGRLVFSGCKGITFLCFWQTISNFFAPNTSFFVIFCRLLCNTRCEIGLMACCFPQFPKMSCGQVYSTSGKMAYGRHRLTSRPKLENFN